MTSGESTQPRPVLCRLWFWPPNLCPGKDFSCSPKNPKNFYVPNFILSSDWQCLKLHLSFLSQIAKFYFFICQKIWEFSYCKTWFIVSYFSCTVLPLPKASFSIVLQMTCYVCMSVWHLEAQWLEKKAGREATFPQDRHRPGWYWSHSALWDGLSPELLFKCWKLCALAGAVGFAFSREKKTLNNPRACILNIEVQGYQSDSLGSVEVILEGCLQGQFLTDLSHPG